MFKPQMIEKEKDFSCLNNDQLPICMVNLDQPRELNQRFFCEQCLQSQDSGMDWIGFKILIQKIENNKKKQLAHLENMIAPIITKIQSFLGHLNTLKSFIVLQLDQLMDNTKDWISNLYSLGQKYSEYSLYKELQIMIMNQVKESNENVQIDQNNQIKQINDSLSTKINSKLDSLKQFEGFQKCQQILQELSSQLYQQQSQSIQCLFYFKPFNYQIIKDNSINQNESCYAIAFNKDCSQVLVGCEKQIQIYQFKQAIFKQIQVLNQHHQDVFTLTFMKKSNQFISGDQGGSILIWSRDNNNQWNCFQTIQEHNDSIRCLILNNNEDVFISCSDDKTIKFWVKQNDWMCQQTITDHQKSVNQLSLNNQNKIISCGSDRLILVIEYSELNKKWIVIQNIKTEDLGYRISFINNNQFTFQPVRGNLMYVYEMNNESKQFTKIKDIVVNQCNSISGGLFPQQFIKQKQLLVNKHGKSINLIRKSEDDQFQVEQSIQFDSEYIYGYMSDDGEYLITWDTESKQIQIRKYTEQ